MARTDVFLVTQGLPTPAFGLASGGALPTGCLRHGLLSVASWGKTLRKGFIRIAGPSAGGLRVDRQGNVYVGVAVNELPA